MKIQFVCGGLEPGHDGVGDYTRRLAGELRRTGHEVQLLALNDAHVDSARSEAGGILRLPRSLAWGARAAAALAEADRFQPDWLSLQLVCYGLHPKGLVHRATPALRRIFVGRRGHIMFHELWIGEVRDAPLSHRIVGPIQRGMIVRMTRLLRPDAVHTSTETYRALLAASGIEADVLPLFGNLPVAEEESTDWLLSALETAHPPFRAEEREKWWIVGFFGSLYREWQPEPLLTQLREASVAADRKPLLVSIGRMNAGGRAQWDRLREAATGLPAVALGAESDARISRFLGTIDFGVCNAPPVLAGKSGATAAMLDHGLPVLLGASDAAFRHDAANIPFTHPGMINAADLAAVLAASRRPARARLAETVEAFIECLMRAPWG